MWGLQTLVWVPLRMRQAEGTATPAARPIAAAAAVAAAVDVVADVVAAVVAAVAAAAAVGPKVLWLAAAWVAAATTRARRKAEATAVRCG